MVIIRFGAAVEAIAGVVDGVVFDVAVGLGTGEFTAVTEGVAVAPFWLFGF